jgi:hypothetical protein
MTVKAGPKDLPHQAAVRRGQMGFYLELSCGQQGCGFSARIGNATEFYVDGEGAELPYGHPVCMSREGAVRGIAGYWRDLLCWECGHRDRESIRLGKPIREPALAWAMFPPPSLDNHPRLCPDCDGLLCDVSMLQMFLDYRADPQAMKAAVQECLLRLKKEREQPSEKDAFDEMFSEYAAELIEREGDPVERMEAEIKGLEGVTTEEQLILFRLGLAPRFPVTPVSLAPLKEAFTSAREKADRLREDMFAKMKQEQCSAQRGSGIRGFAARLLGKKPKTTGGDSFGWINRPAAKAKRALDAQIEKIRKLTTHAWVAMRLAKDERGTLEMFHKRCPKCKAEPLGVRQYQT